MARIEVPDSDWPMHDWDPEDIVVDGIVMALKGCGDDDAPVAVLTDEGRELRILGVRVAVRHERADPPVILRVFRGEAKQGQLEGYIQEADMGANADAESNAGLAALYLGSQPPTRFITVSAWTSWSSIEKATGGNVRRPVATRHSERLVGADVDHYEMLPNAIRPPVRMARTGSAR